MNIGLLRLKLLLADHGRTVAVALLVAGVVAVAATGWVYATPPTETVTERVDVQTVGTAVVPSATITGNSTLWDRGTTLTNRSIYPMAAPELTLTVRTTVPADESVSVEQQLRLVYRATRDGTTFWQSEQPLTATKTTTTNGTVTSSTTIDVPAIRDRLDTYNEDLTGLGRAEAALHLAVTYETGRYTGEFTKTATLTIAENGYWLSDRLAASTTHSRRVTREVQGEPNQSILFGLAGLSLLFLASAGTIWYYRDTVADRSVLKERLDRTRFEEWISNGRIDQPPAGRTVPVETLADLVDIAIDSNKRVIHDPGRDHFVVLDGPILYRFDPSGKRPTAPEQSDGPDRIRNSLDDLFEDAESGERTDAWDSLLSQND